MTSTLSESEISATSAQTEMEASPEPIVRVTSATGRYATTVSHASMSLIAGIGMREDGQSVLVPFVECEIATENYEDTESDQLTDVPAFDAHSILMTFENAAFLAEAFSSEFAKIAPNLVSLSQGPLRPVPERIAYALDRLKQAQRNVLALIDVLEKSGTDLSPPPLSGGTH